MAGFSRRSEMAQPAPAKPPPPTTTWALTRARGRAARTVRRMPPPAAPADNCRNIRRRIRGRRPRTGGSFPRDLLVRAGDISWMHRVPQQPVRFLRRRHMLNRMFRRLGLREFVANPLLQGLQIAPFWNDGGGQITREGAPSPHREPCPPAARDRRAGPPP